MKVNVVADHAMEKKVTLSLTKDTVLSVLKQALQKKAMTLRVPGFRPGKAPLEHVFQKEGGKILRNVVETLLREKLYACIQENGWNVREYRYFAEPSLSTVDSLDKITDISLSIDVFLMPTFPDIDFKKITLEDVHVVLSDDDVEKELHERAKNTMDAHPLKEKRPAKKGDTLAYHLVYIDEKGQEYANDGTFILGSGKFPKEFEDTLEGIDAGHHIQERIRVPKDFPIAALSGQKVLFKVIFSDILETVPHKVDDRFAKSQGAENLSVYKDTVKKELGDFFSQTVSEMRKKKQLTDILSEKLTFDLPPTLLTETVDTRWHGVEQELKGADEEKKKAYYAQHGWDIAHPKDSLTKEITRQLRQSLFLGHIAEQQKFSISTEELRQMVERFAQDAQTTVENLLPFFQKNPGVLEQIKQDMLHSKALVFLISQCPTEKKEMPFAELKNKSS